MTDETIIASGLKRFRQDFHLSQKEVASLLGITSQAYQNYEYGKITPSGKSLLKLARTYNVSTDYLLGLCEKPRPTIYDEKEISAAFEFRDKWKSALQTAFAQGIIPQAVTA